MTKEREIILYTGNDDNIVVDLLTPYILKTNHGRVEIKFNGGLLGHWGVWTHSAVNLFNRIKQLQQGNMDIPVSVLTNAMQVTDMNAALFDAANGFTGCIPGIHEVLRRNKIFAGIWCLDPKEKLSPNQNKEISRVIHSYPYLCDQEFIREHIDEWLNLNNG